MRRPLIDASLWNRDRGKLSGLFKNSCLYLSVLGYQVSFCWYYSYRVLDIYLRLSDLIKDQALFKVENIFSLGENNRNTVTMEVQNDPVVGSMYDAYNWIKMGYNPDDKVIQFCADEWVQMAVAFRQNNSRVRQVVQSDSSAFVILSFVIEWNADAQIDGVPFDQLLDSRIDELIRDNVTAKAIRATAVELRWRLE